MILAFCFRKWTEPYQNMNNTEWKGRNVRLHYFVRLFSPLARIELRSSQNNIPHKMNERSDRGGRMTMTTNENNYFRAFPIALNGKVFPNAMEVFINANMNVIRILNFIEWISMEWQKFSISLIALKGREGSAWRTRTNERERRTMNGFLFDLENLMFFRQWIKSWIENDDQFGSTRKRKISESRSSLFKLIC